MNGKVELERLVVDVVHTLRAAEMLETLRAFDARVLSRDAAELFDSPADGIDGPTFKPMVELLLRELAALSVMLDAAVADRHQRAMEAMDLAGF